MTNSLTIQHINQTVEIKYTDPERQKDHTCAGTLAGFNTDGSTYKWWLVGNDTRYSATTLTVRTADEIKNAWMQSSGFGSADAWPSWGGPDPRRTFAEDTTE